MTMYIDIIPNRGSPPAVLLRESYRQGNAVKKRTLGNISSLSMDQVEAIRLVLKGVRIAPVDQLFDITSSLNHGNVHAVLTAMRRLGIALLLSSRPCREQRLALALIASQILSPDSKLASKRKWQNTTLPAELSLDDVQEKELYTTMDWLLARQPAIEKKLAKRHLGEGSMVLYDLTSSYVTGKCCPLATLGYSRDGLKGTLQINYGLVTDHRGCPVSVEVFEGNTSDANTLEPRVKSVRERFGITRLTVVGDRGMIGHKQIKSLKDIEGVDWITALKSVSIKSLVEGGLIQLGLFDERNLFEFTSPEYQGERLVACRNPELAKQRASKREDLLTATKKELDCVQRMVASGKLSGAGAIGVRAGKVVNKYKMGKHIELTIEKGQFAYRVKEEAVAAEAALDGIYVIRTSIPVERLSASDTVRRYKQLSQVEQAFRTMKGLDLKVRPIFHHLDPRVRAHIFLCMLAYYVEWHMREAWRSLLFYDDSVIEDRKTRDPVAPAQRSETAKEKARTHTLDDGTSVHSFRTLLANLKTIVRNLCHTKGGKGTTFNIDTILNPQQQHAFNLLESINV